MWRGSASRAPASTIQDAGSSKATTTIAAAAAASPATAMPPLGLPASSSTFFASRARCFVALLGAYALGLVTIHLLGAGDSACGLLRLDRESPEPLSSAAASPRMASSARHQGDTAATAAAAAGDDGFQNPSLTHGPLTVLAISQSRTSSTVAFNLARILLERLDPNTASGWENDIVGLEDEFDSEWRATLVKETMGPAHASGNLSMIVKSHTPFHDYLQAVPTPFDFVLTSYRDPYEAICSEARKFHPYLFTDAQAAKASCVERADVEEGIQGLAARAPRGSLHVDASLLWSREGLVAVANELVAQWGVTPGTRGSLDLEAVVADVLQLKPPPTDVFAMHAPRTLLHPQHNTDAKSAEGKAACKALLATLARDPTCQELHERYVRLFGGERKMYGGEEMAGLLLEQA